MKKRIYLALAVLAAVITLPFSGSVQAGRPGSDRIGLTAHAVPRQVSPGESVIVKLVIFNGTDTTRDLQASGSVSHGDDEVMSFRLDPVSVGAGERRAFEHALEIGDDAALGSYLIHSRLVDTGTSEQVAEARTGFAVREASPIRLALTLHPAQTQPGGGVLLHVGVQNRTEGPLTLVVAGRVTFGDRGVGDIPPRRVALAANERMGLRIPFAVSENARPGVYVAEIIAGESPREPFAARHARFQVVPRPPIMIDAAVRPNVAQQGDTIRLSTRITNNTDAAQTLSKSGVIRGDRGAVHVFRPHPFTIRAGQSQEDSHRFKIPEDLPPGRYVFEAFLGVRGRRPIDHSSAEFTVRPSDGG